MPHFPFPASVVRGNKNGCIFSIFTHGFKQSHELINPLIILTQCGQISFVLFHMAVFIAVIQPDI